MGVRTADLCGHWKDELIALEKGLAALQKQLGQLPPGATLKPAPQFKLSEAARGGTTPQVIHEPVTSAPVGQPIMISAEVMAPAGVKWVRLRFRSVNQHQDFRSVPMLSNEATNRYEATIPAEEIALTWDLMYFIEVMDKDGNGAIYPDLNKG